MNLEEAKTRLERYKGTLENSVKMYEKTLQEMIDKGSDPESISLVLQMKKDTQGQINDIEDLLRNANSKIAGGKNLVVAYNEIVDKLFKFFNPYFKHRFTIDFGTEDIKEYFVERVAYSEESKTLQVTFRNSEQFFVPEYFNKNKEFENVKLYILSPIGEKKAVIEFWAVTLGSVGMDEFNYKTDEVLMSQAVFNFKRVEYKSL